LPQLQYYFNSTIVLLKLPQLQYYFNSTIIHSSAIGYC